MNKIKVLVVDDSAVVRQVVSEVLTRDPGIEVMGAVADPIFAMERMHKAWPDVIVLDVEMPRMDGITFLHKLMAERPTPVVVCSTLTEKGAETTLQALAAGAVQSERVAAWRHYHMHGLQFIPLFHLVSDLSERRPWLSC